MVKLNNKHFMTTLYVWWWIIRNNTWIKKFSGNSFKLIFLISLIDDWLKYKSAQKSVLTPKWYRKVNFCLIKHSSMQDGMIKIVKLDFVFKHPYQMRFSLDEPTNNSNRLFLNIHLHRNKQWKRSPAVLKTAEH